MKKRGILLTILMLISLFSFSQLTDSTALTLRPKLFVENGDTFFVWSQSQAKQIAIYLSQRKQAKENLDLYAKEMKLMIQKVQLKDSLIGVYQRDSSYYVQKLSIAESSIKSCDNEQYKNQKLLKTQKKAIIGLSGLNLVLLLIIFL